MYNFRNAQDRRTEFKLNDKWQHHEAYDIIRNLYFLPPNDVKWKECNYEDFPLKVVERRRYRGKGFANSQRKSPLRGQKRQNCHFNDNSEEF